MAGPRHVVVGSGTAGFNAITTLLQLEPSADVTLVSAEPPYARMVLPYYLSSEIEEANVYTISPERLASLGVRAMFGRRASGLDRASKRVLLDSGEAVPYDDMLIATGSSAVRPPVPGLDGARVFDHWTLADTQALRQVIAPGKHVAIVGAGFIAFTIVNPLLHAGCRLTLVEREPSVLPRMLNAEAAEILEEWTRRQGIGLVTGAALQRVQDAPDGRKRLVLPDQTLEADVVIVATGIAPNIAWLRDSGLASDRGLLVDERMRTSDPAIFAAGDVAEIVDATTGQRAVMAIEVAAMEQGRVIGAQMAGQPATYAGGMLMNVVEAAGLQAASFGSWAGSDATEGRALGGHYRRYVWQDDRLIGGVLVGPARQVAGENEMGMLKGLIQAGRPLGAWKDLLVVRPFELKKVFLGAGTVGQLLPRTLLGQPSLPLVTGK
ncbi:MAG: NAD(P)/FAD-dependent oxidoreductase [Chloroflexota bacterium]|nr:NAD(P)/FAD-dependent oxidoreductase [Chloroflexota bacterium]